MKFAIHAVVFALLTSSAVVFAVDPPFKKGEQVFLAADEHAVAEEEKFPPDRLTRGDTLKIIERKADEALVGFAGDTQYKQVLGVKTLVGDGKPVARQTWVPFAKLVRTREEAIAPAGEKPAPPGKPSAEEWRSKLAGTWREVGWEQYGRRHRLRESPLPTKEGLLPATDSFYFWQFDEKGARHFTRDPSPWEQVYTEVRIDASITPAILDLMFVVETKHIYAHRYGLEMEGPRLRLAFHGANYGKNSEELQRNLKRLSDPKRTWTQPSEAMLVKLLERDKEETEESLK